MDAVKFLEIIPEADRDAAVAKLRSAETVDQVKAIAQEFGLQISNEDADELLHKMGCCILSDDDLDAAAGGGNCMDDAVPAGCCEYC